MKIYIVTENTYELNANNFTSLIGYSIDSVSLDKRSANEKIDFILRSTKFKSDRLCYADLNNRCLIVNLF